eukprot:COSAG04_NODE_538_length_12896_cov_41.168243_4_plen_183_part_00
MPGSKKKARKRARKRAAKRRRVTFSRAVTTQVIPSSDPPRTGRTRGGKGGAREHDARGLIQGHHRALRQRCLRRRRGFLPSRRRQRCVRRELASPSGLWVQSLSLSFPLPRRTAPFLLPRIALYPQSAWWRGCGGLLDGGCGAAAAAARRGGVCDWATKSKQSMSITSMQTYLCWKKLNVKQ